MIFYIFPVTLSYKTYIRFPSSLTLLKIDFLHDSFEFFPHRAVDEEIDGAEIVIVRLLWLFDSWPVGREEEVVDADGDTEPGGSKVTLTVSSC